MEKLHFIYIGKDWDGNIKNNLPTGPLKAIIAKYDDGEMHYVPIIPNKWETVDQVKEVWVRGQGWKKVNKRKTYDIPVFDGTIEHFYDYLKTWGMDVMAYCLNGDLFHRSGYCCDINYINEWNCLMHYGPEAYTEFAIHYEAMREYQKKWFREHHLPKFNAHGYGDITNNYLFKPELNLGFSFLPIPMIGVNILHDDNMLEKLYRRLRYWELYEKHDQYGEYMKRKKAADDYRNGRTLAEMRYDREYDNLMDYALEIDHIIYTDVENQIKYELELDFGTPEFPKCFADRLKILFGPDVSREYEFLVKFMLEKEAA